MTLSAPSSAARQPPGRDRADPARTSAEVSDDAADVQAARHGDRAAFARLHLRYAPMVHGIALARGPVGDAHDIVQESFLHALDGLHSLRDDGAFGPWLASIARNMAGELHRRGRLRSHESLHDLPARQASVDASPQLEQANMLLRVIRELPESYAETLMLRLVEGLTGPQIAACTGLTHGSVRVNLTRGMSLLRVRLKEKNINVEDSP